MSQTDPSTSNAAEAKTPAQPPEQFEEVDIGDPEEDPLESGESGANQTGTQGTSPST